MISMDGIREFFILLARNYKDFQEAINRPALPTKTSIKKVTALKSLITTSLDFSRIMVTV
jgi:hypothetical protein